MKKSDSKNTEQTLENELKRLRKENDELKSKLKFQKEADKAEIKELKKELKKKDAPRVTLTDEQRKFLSTLFPDIYSLFS